MAKTVAELVALKEKLTRLEKEVNETKQELERECTHPPEHSDFDSLGTTCELCGAFEYDLGPRAVPKEKDYPTDSVQCKHCGGFGCETCEYKGWFTPSSHSEGSRCDNKNCGKPIPPDHMAVYCSDVCAHADAVI